MTAGPAPGAAGRRPPGRGPKVRAAVLAATLDELIEHGYAALTMENVARRAGVHKTTVYRRWRNREGLLTDAATQLADTRVDYADSGDIRAYLHAFARSLVGFLTSPTGQAVIAVGLSDAARSPEMVHARRRFFEDRFRHAEPAIRAAIACGELPAGTDPAEVVRATIAPIYLRLVVTAEPISERIADTAAEAALAAARAGVLGPPAGARSAGLRPDDG